VSIFFAVVIWLGGCILDVLGAEFQKAFVSVHYPSVGGVLTRAKDVSVINPREQKQIPLPFAPPIKLRKFNLGIDYLSQAIWSDRANSVSGLQRGLWNQRAPTPVGKIKFQMSRKVIGRGLSDVPPVDADNQVAKEGILYFDGLGDRGLNSDIGPKLTLGGIAGDISRTRSMVSSQSRENGGSNGGEQRNDARTKSPSGNPCLVEDERSLCVGGIRRTSSLYEAVSGFAMLFCCVGAGVALPFAFMPGKPFKPIWLAVSAAGLIFCGLFARAAIIGDVWLLGL
jgi:hypothetical protein